MSWIDRALMAFSPERALRRVRARRQAEVLMNYDAAGKGRRTHGWKAPGSSADTAAASSRAQLRNLSRDMIRNRSLAARGQAVITGNVVGTGILPSVASEDDDRAAQMMEVIRAHLMTPALDAYGVSGLRGIQTQVMNAVFSDGEVLVRRRSRNLQLEPELRLPFQVQVMEVDHLDETIMTHGQNLVIEGIEYGPTGRAVAYHLYDEHPGDAQRLYRGRYVSRRVPASEILHIRRVDRPGQMRGVPWLAPVMMTIGELSDYQEAQILKQRVAALLSFFVEASDDGDVYAGSELTEVAPGAVVGLKPGQKVTPSQPPKVDEYPEFMREGVRTIATGLGLTYESFGDLTGVNFSSGRMGRMEMDRFVQVWQQELIIGQLCAGIARWTQDAWSFGRLAGRIPRHLTVPPTLEWTAPRRPLIDPVKEIGAAVDEIEAGLNSRQRKQREMGLDPDVIARERAEDAAREPLPQRTTPAGTQTETTEQEDT